MKFIEDRSEALRRWVESTYAFQSKLAAEALERGDRPRSLTPETELRVAWEEHVPFEMNYLDFHRPPLIHQLRDIYRFKDQQYFGLFYEPRCGKSKVALDIFRYRHQRGDVDALLVFADPNGVHRIWTDDEPVKDFPLEELNNLLRVAWKSGGMSKKRREELLAVRAHAGPILVAFYCGSLITPNAWKYVEWLLKKRKVMIVADEASWAANFSARTKKLLTLGNFFKHNPLAITNVVVKAILDATPVDEGPDDIYYPTQFLRKGLLGFTSPEAFRARYHEYEMEEVEEERDGRTVIVQRPKMGHNYKQDQAKIQLAVRRGAKAEDVQIGFPIFKGYRNLTELNAKLMQIGSRVLRADVSDAPSKVYVPRYFELTEKQRRVYDRLRAEYVLELGSGEHPVKEVLKRMVRLQMVTRNYHPPETSAEECAHCEGTGYSFDDECHYCVMGYVTKTGQLERIDTRNSALEALLAEVEATRYPVVVWACYRQDLTDVIEGAAAAGKHFLRYDGTLKAQQREENYQVFRAGEGDGIAGLIRSALSKGKDLTRARTMIYYSNEFSLRARRQTEDRSEGMFRDVSTDIVDLIALDTRNADVVDSLRSKRSIAEQITGDPITKWI